MTSISTNTSLREFALCKRTVLLARARWSGFGPRVHVPIWFTSDTPFAKPDHEGPANEISKTPFCTAISRGTSWKSRFCFATLTMFWKRDCSHSRLISPSTRQNTVRVANKTWEFQDAWSHIDFFWDFATLTRFWRGASGHENSRLESSPIEFARFWSANDDSCTLWSELVVF